MKAPLPRSLSPAPRHLHAFLFPVYAVLLLYQQNLGEAALAQTLMPMAAGLAFAACLWLALALPCPDREKRALAAFALLLPSYYYRPLHDGLAGMLEAFGSPAADLPAHLAIAALAAAAILLLARARRSLANANRLLGLILLALRAWSLAAIAWHHAAKSGQRRARQFVQRAGMKASAPDSGRPDIYCLILDEFASLETARDVFGLDHSAFADRLRTAGFHIAEKSRGRYVWTDQAIAALLNMEEPPAGSDAGWLVRNSRAARFLKDNGYRLYDFPYRTLTAMELSERHYRFPVARASLLFDDFYRALAETSVLYPLVERWQRDEERYGALYREQVLYAFDRLPAVARKPGPKFVLLHLYSPHAPFVFDAEGRSVAAEHHLDYSERKYYLGQYLYISRRVAELAERILRESARPPVIVILSDHGYRGSIRKPHLHVVAESEKKKIFLALHLPGVSGKALDPALSPLNVFRLIFNRYFGQELPLLPEPAAN